MALTRVSFADRFGREEKGAFVRPGRVTIHQVITAVHMAVLHIAYDDRVIRQLIARRMKVMTATESNTQQELDNG